MNYLTIKDKEYKKIIKKIMWNSNFKKLIDIKHHGISRMEHSLKISYYSYVIAKKLKMDYVSVARGGLLHDFFLNGNERNLKDRFFDTFRHPSFALSTTKNIFDINNLEENIIISHMFPIYLSIPKYKESILVNLVDKIVGLKEMVQGLYCMLAYKFKFTYVFMLLLLTK